MNTKMYFQAVRRSSLVWLATLSVASLCLGQDWSRAGKSDLYFLYQTLGGDQISGLDGLVELQTDDTQALGFGIGANGSDHVNMNMELLFGSVDTIWTFPTLPDVILEEPMDIWLWNLNLDIHILKSRLTPLLTGGIGLFGWSNDEVSETNFSYNLGAGARWDITDNFALKLVYRITWTELRDADEAFGFDGIALSVVYMFQ